MSCERREGCETECWLVQMQDKVQRETPSTKLNVNEDGRKEELVEMRVEQRQMAVALVQTSKRDAVRPDRLVERVDQPALAPDVELHKHEVEHTGGDRERERDLAVPDRVEAVVVDRWRLALDG